MIIIEPEKQDQKLKYYLDSGEYKKVGIFFGHGLGDCVMFRILFDKLKELYPDIYFNMILQNGLNQEIIYPSADLVNNREEIEKLDYDLIASINFPVEVDPTLTKMELCCKEELGIELTTGYKKLPYFPSKLVAVHYNLTCLPKLANPTEEIAEKIWNEIIEAGFIPIESHFSHTFDNPVNKRFKFVDCSVRRCKPRVDSLLGLLGSCAAFVGVVSGNFHCAMSILPHNRICYLEKDIPVSRFTHEDIKTVDIKNYKDGSIKKWIEELQNK